MRPNVRERVDQWMANDDLFFAELEEGYKWELSLYHRLLRDGVSAVHVTPIPANWPRHERREWLSRYGDIAVPDLDGIHLEVKSRRIRFTSPEDFPYPTVYVDGEGSRRQKIVPDDRVAYVLVSQVTGAVVWVPPGTPTRKRRIWDRVRNIPVLIHEVPREALLAYGELVEYLKHLRA